MKSKISNTTKVVMICRVSSKGQKNNTSSETQNREAEYYAQENGLEIVHKVVEVASGTTQSLEKRERYQEALSLCISNNWDLLVSNADRLCRNTPQAVEEVINKGIKIWEASSGLERSLNNTEVQRRIVEAEAEAVKIKARTHRGIISRIQSGKYHGGTEEYRSDAARLKAIEVKRKRILNNENNKKAVKLAIEKREQGWTFSDISDYLNENGYKPRATVIESKKFRAAYGIQFSTNEMRKKLHKSQISFSDWEKHQQKLSDCKKRETAKKEREGRFTTQAIRNLVLYFDKNAVVSNRVVITDKGEIYVSGRFVETKEAKRILLDTKISLNKAAKGLNDLHIKAERGGKFYPNTVKQIREKLKSLIVKQSEQSAQ